MIDTHARATHNRGQAHRSPHKRSTSNATRRTTRLSALITAGVLAATLGVAGTTATAAPSHPHTAAPSTIAAEADDTEFSAAPGTPAGADGRTRFTTELEPGQRVDDHLVISNDGPSELTFDVYAADASNDEDGAFLVSLPTDPVENTARWISINGTEPEENAAAHATITVPAGTRTAVPFTISLPADARPGDHAAAIVATLAGNDGGVQVDHRLATRLYIRVAGPLQPAISVGGVTTTYTGSLNPFAGELSVTYTLTNTGNIALRGTVSTWLTAFWGEQIAGAVPDVIEEMLPGTTRTITRTIPSVGQIGPATLTVRLDPYVGPETLDPGPLASTSREHTIWAAPWMLITILLVAAAGTAVAVWRSKRRTRIHQQELAHARISATTPDGENR